MKKKITTLFAVLLIAATSQSQWSLTGNTGTNPAVNFIGTKDTQALVFRTHNQMSGIIDPAKDNTAFGWLSLSQNSTGNNNTAYGSRALYFNTLGIGNIAIGPDVLYKNVDGHMNIGIGRYALQVNTSGQTNIAVGEAAMLHNETGSENTAVGVQSLSNSNGWANTAYGSVSLYDCKDGWGNTAVGYWANFNMPASYENSTAIGFQSTISASNQVRIGDNNVTSIGGAVGWTTVSDGRFKSNIQSNVPGLAFIKQLKPVTYTLNISALNKYLRPKGNVDKDGKKRNVPERNADIAAGEKIVRTGFIAQDVVAAAEKAGFDFDAIDKPKNENDLYGIRYAEFVTPLVQSVQELSNMNDSLKAQLSNLQSQFNELLQQVNKLKNSIVSTSINSTLPFLKQNSPNPFNNNTVISYYLPPTTKNAQLIVSSIKGQLLKSISLNSYGEGQVTIHSGELAAGSYFYTLTVDGQRIDTRQMILTK